MKPHTYKQKQKIKTALEQAIEAALIVLDVFFCSTYLFLNLSDTPDVTIAPHTAWEACLSTLSIYVDNKVGMITDAIRKRKLTFFGYMLRINDNCLTKRILTDVWEFTGKT